MKVKILDNKFTYFIFLCICFEFPYFDTFSLFNKLMDIAKIILVLFLFILFIKNEKKFPRDIICLTLYAAVIIISTFFNDYGNIKGAFALSIKILAISLLSKMCMERNPKKFINVAVSILELMVLINFITIIFFPNGLYSTLYQKQNFFLGYDNRHIVFILPMLCLKSIYDYTFFGKLSKMFWFDTFISILTVYIRFSVTSVIGLLIFITYIIFLPILKNIKFINFKNTYMLNIFAFLGLVILRVQEKFAYIIKILLKKDLTFTGRTLIWDNTIKYIKRRPFFGYGVESYDIRGLKNNNLAAIFAHNQILEIIYQGGLILYVLYSYLMLIIYKKFKEYKDNNVIKIFSIYFLALFIMMLTEVYNNPTIFMMYMIAANIDLLIRFKEGEKNE